VGRVLDLHLGRSNRQAKLIAIDEQPEDDVMQLDRFGKADRLAGQTLDTGPQRQMFALDLLRVLLAHVVLGLVKVTRVGAPIIGVIARDAKGREQHLQLQKHRVLAPPKDIRQHLSRMVIDRMPQPALRVLLPHVGPHLIDFRFVSPPDNHVHIVRRQRVEERLVHRGERRLFFLTR